jgi:hypothetical protein
MRRFILCLSLLLLCSTVCYARNCLTDGFLPPNSLRIPPEFLANGIDEQRFNSVLDKIERYARPRVSDKGGSLYVERLWSDARVNAMADRQGTRWIVTFFGGLARHPLLTEDGFALVACHEIGHHLGGAPKVRGQWAANEGQSDYYATLKCLRDIFLFDNNIDVVSKLDVPAKVAQACERQFSNANNTALCKRTAMAGLSTAKVGRDVLGGGPALSFDTPDPSVVEATNDDHPIPQCRLDTYFSGSVCAVPTTSDVSESDPAIGTCSEEQGFTVGNRPHCWYKPGAITPPNPPNPPDPPMPVPSIAKPLLVAGFRDYVLRNPYLNVPIAYDVSEFRNAGGVYLEFLQPGREFLQPNGTVPDPYRISWLTRRGSAGVLNLLPISALPGWGAYSMRVIPLDQSGMNPVGRFSDSSHLILMP